MRTIALLTISNIFMTFAWYGHLKYRDVPLFKVILLSWGSRSSNTASRFPPTALALTNSPQPSSRPFRKSLPSWFFSVSLSVVFEAADSMESHRGLSE